MADLPQINVGTITVRPAEEKPARPDADAKEVARAERELNEHIQDQVLQDHGRFRVTRERVAEYRTFLRTQTQLSERQVNESLRNYFESGNGSLLPGRDDPAVRTALAEEPHPSMARTEPREGRETRDGEPRIPTSRGDEGHADTFVRSPDPRPSTDRPMAAKVPQPNTPPPPPPGGTPPPPPPGGTPPPPPPGLNPPPAVVVASVVPGETPPPPPPGTPLVSGTPVVPGDVPGEPPVITGTHYIVMGDPPRPGTGHPVEVLKHGEDLNRTFQFLTSTARGPVPAPVPTALTAGETILGRLHRQATTRVASSSRRRGGDEASSEVSDRELALGFRRSMGRC